MFLGYFFHKMLRSYIAHRAFFRRRVPFENMVADITTP
jgi:hypothetical protein